MHTSFAYLARVASEDAIYERNRRGLRKLAYVRRRVNKYPKDSTDGEKESDRTIKVKITPSSFGQGRCAIRARKPRCRHRDISQVRSHRNLYRVTDEMERFDVRPTSVESATFVFTQFSRLFHRKFSPVTERASKVLRFPQELHGEIFREIRRTN